MNTTTTVRPNVRDRLRQAQKDNAEFDERGDLVDVSGQSLAELLNCTDGHFSKLRIDNPRSPKLEELIALARRLQMSIEEMLDLMSEGLVHFNGPVAWRLSGVARGMEAIARRFAVNMMLQGESVERIAERVGIVLRGRRKQALPRFTRERIHDMAQGGLSMGLAQFDIGDGSAIEDRPLADELERALAADAEQRAAQNPGNRPPHRVRVRVVRNLADKSFKRDPSAPYLVACLAHNELQMHLDAHPMSYSLGFAGGIHCSMVVKATGAFSSPFPEQMGDKQLTLVPLTLEPFRNHSMPTADAVVGQMAAALRDLLGAERVKGLTFQCFGYVVDDRITELDDVPINLVRDQYPELDVAIYGCGDVEQDGWLEKVMRRLRITSESRVVTDVCLHPITEDAEIIGLPGGREFIGVSVPDIRRLVGNEGKLALLLTSGPTKGVPLTVVARAGCAGTIICDQAAANAALAALADPNAGA